MDTAAILSALPEWSDWLAAVVWAGGAWLLARAVQAPLQRTLQSRGVSATGPLIEKAVHWTILGSGAAMALSSLGVDLSVVLTAAGVFSVAVGFAAQTSVSNLISGAFLLTEGAIKVGDVLEIAGVSGEVVSVDLLSLKLRTFDNRLVRIPNEQVIRSDVKNLSAFPIRRAELSLVVPPEADLAAVEATLLQVAEGLTDAMVEPAPQVFLGPFQDGGLQLRFCVWARREVFFGLQNALHRAAREQLLASGFRFAGPRRVLVGAPDAPPVALTTEGGELSLDPEP